MPFTPIEVQPGVVKSESPYAARGRWIDMDHVRFVSGKPEKIGGTQRFILDDFDGIARAAKAWASYLGAQCLVFGTACGLYLYRESTLSLITPYRTDATDLSLGTDPFAVTIGQTSVTVTSAAHGITSVGTLVTFSGATAGGGITIDGDYLVTEIVNGNSFKITHSAAATSTDATTGGASVLASYELNCGNVSPAYLLGWGVGNWGEGYWGVDASGAAGVLSEPANWSFGVYGEDLVVNPSGGTIFMYDTSMGIVRPEPIADAPDQIRFTFVTPERYIMALGCTTLGGGYDTMTVRWPDIEDSTDWTPSDINTANQRKLQGGTRLMAGTALSDGVSVVWSDSHIFLFQFTGSSLVYASRQVGDKCGLIAPHAFATAAGTAFWMSDTSFHMYSGYTQQIPNVDDIQDFVFRDISLANKIKSFSFYNPVYDEVWFVYPSRAATEPDRYVMVNLDGYVWSHGTWDRSAAALYTIAETRPILFGTNGVVYVHDVEESPDDDTAALPAHIELAPTDVSGGNVSVDIFGFVPDTQRQTGDMVVYLYGKDHPRGAVMSEDTLTVTPTDALVDARVAGRQFGMRLSCEDIGCDFRLGIWGLEITGAGKKRGSVP